MGFQRLTPIHSVHDEDPDLSEDIDVFVVGLGEWIDALQDLHAAGDFAGVVERATAHGARAEELGYPSLREAAEEVIHAARAGEAESARKGIGDLIEIVQRIRLGHRSAA